MPDLTCLTCNAPLAGRGYTVRVLKCPVRGLGTRRPRTVDVCLCEGCYEDHARREFRATNRGVILMTGQKVRMRRGDS